MGVEQAELLAAMDGIESVVDIQHDALGYPGIGGAIEIDERPPHAHQRKGAGLVLQTRDG